MRMPRVFADAAAIGTVQPTRRRGYPRRANNASACRQNFSWTWARGTSFPRRPPAAKKIYLRQRHHAFGRPRPVANNSLIYLSFPFITFKKIDRLLYAIILYFFFLIFQSTLHTLTYHLRRLQLFMFELRKNETYQTEEFFVENFESFLNNGRAKWN